MLGNNEVSLYFHFPFCLRKCPYCHFYSLPFKEEQCHTYVEALALEWEQKKALLHKKEVVTVYFGGGTPSLLAPKHLQERLEAMSFLAPTAEITLEANPDTLSPELVSAYAKVGINRMSIGVQSFLERDLRVLGRSVTPQVLLEAIEMAYSAGIDNISVDLMYGLPQQSLEEWQHNLQELRDLPVSHVSLYDLVIEPGTVFDRRRKEIEPTLASTDLAADMLRCAMDELAAQGFQQYEISAFAKEGALSRHNYGYWAGRPFLGLGPSAFSYWEGRRFSNVANLQQYVRTLKEGASPMAFEEKLSEEAAKRELLALRFRLLKGVNVEAWAQDEGVRAILASLVDEGFLQRVDSSLALTRQGVLFYDHVARELIL